MLRRLFVLVAVGLVATAVVSDALAARVKVRVEGKTQTIFGAQEATIDVPTPLVALHAASLDGEFYYHVTQTAFGPYVDQIGLYPATAQAGWVFKVNGASPPVGADQVRLNDGDRVLWYYAEFGPEGGPPTLDVRVTRSRGRPCFTALSFDDAGRSTPATSVVFVLDGRRISAFRGRMCIQRKHWHRVRVTKKGSVPSRVVTPALL